MSSHQGAGGGLGGRRSGSPARLGYSALELDMVMFRKAHRRCFMALRAVCSGITDTKHTPGRGRIAFCVSKRKRVS